MEKKGKLMNESGSVSCVLYTNRAVKSTDSNAGGGWGGGAIMDDYK